jgi:hypothetical protein
LLTRFFGETFPLTPWVTGRQNLSHGITFKDFRQRQKFQRGKSMAISGTIIVTAAGTPLPGRQQRKRQVLGL